jgi:hypothetical protein
MELASLTMALSLMLAGGGQPTDGQATLKIHAKTPARVANASVVIRSAEQLGKLRNMDAEKASADLARQLKVERIDWAKQMVIVAK